MKVFSKIRTAKWEPFVESELLSWAGNMTVIKEDSTKKKNLELTKMNFEPLFILLQELDLKARGEI